MLCHSLSAVHGCHAWKGCGLSARPEATVVVFRKDRDDDDDFDDFDDDFEERVRDPEDDEESSIDTEDIDRNCPLGMTECPTTGDCIEDSQRYVFGR